MDMGRLRAGYAALFVLANLICLQLVFRLLGWVGGGFGFPLSLLSRNSP